MKKTVIILLSLILTISVLGQKETKTLKRNVEEVEVTPPKFTGIENVATAKVENSSLVKRFISKTFECPKSTVECGKEGTEVIQFTVTPLGNVTNFNVINSVCKDIDTELIRVLRQTNGMWRPGSNNGEAMAMEQEVSILIGNYKVDKIGELFVSKAQKYFEKGSSSLFVDNKPKKALRFYNNSIKYMPNDKSQLLLRGICNYELGNEEKARKDWNRIVSLGGINYDIDQSVLAEMKGFEEMTRILANK